jgi:hypothetical protein
MSGAPINRRAVALAILVAALGYFVDIYDLILFSIVRVPSLRAIGVPQDQIFSTGVMLLNMQMSGMLIGGIVWGVLGDKRGRLSVLFGTIILYSLANLANAWVTTVPQYAVLRLIAGIGLAGELGAGITLVSELMPKESRGYATSLVSADRHLRRGGGLLRRPAVRLAHRVHRGRRDGAGAPAAARRRAGVGPVRAGAGQRSPAWAVLQVVLDVAPRVAVHRVHPRRRADLVRGGDPHHVLARDRQGHRPEPGA